MTHIPTATIGSVHLGPGRPAIIVPLTGATADELTAQGQAIATDELGSRVDIVEWRVDLLEGLGGLVGADGATDRDRLATIAEQLHEVLGDRPLLATVRTTAEGGNADLTDAAYLELVSTLSSLDAVAAVDVEHRRGTADEVVDAVHAAGVPVIASHHDFEATPTTAQILEHLGAMAATGADVVKIAVMPQEPRDVLTLLDATLLAPTVCDRPVITMAMDRLGAATRLTGGAFGSVATFATLGAASAPGQLPLQTMITILDAIHGETA